MRSGLDVDGLSAFVSVALGLAITRFTTLFSTPLSHPLVDVAQLGAPLTWITLVISAGLKEIYWTGFVVDVGFWSLIVYIFLVTVIHLKSEITKSERRKRR